ncbi:hypothetical protein NDU88_006629 [Pleurodeles waltl]|uniref:Uncharacterized protein n=1 Tax=Pleurodeles waltl TaxID=8319 RepID=A0AAV7QLA8_PLEWA|nr:hypothetical protein NDU88_006629 [Pleurodeles waltl]
MAPTRSIPVLGGSKERDTPASDRPECVRRMREDVTDEASGARCSGEVDEDGVVSATWVLWHEHKNERSQHESENVENVECEVSGMWEAFVGEPLRRRDRDGMKR